MSKKDITLEVLKLTVKALEKLNDQLVYLGGSTISLFVTEPDAVKIRETNDVDCVVEVGHRNDYEELSKQLRAVGFSEDTRDGVLCRFRKGSLILDVMPTDSKILGFTNAWYAEGFKNSTLVPVDGIEIRVFDLPYLLATKIEAFKGRGMKQFSTSHDIEDIVTLFDGREGIAEDLKRAEPSVRTYLKQHLELMVKSSMFIDGLDGHISDRSNIPVRKEIVVSRIRDFLK